MNLLFSFIFVVEFHIIHICMKTYCIVVVIVIKGIFSNKTVCYLHFPTSISDAVFFHERQHEHLQTVYAMEVIIGHLGWEARVRGTYPQW